MDRITGRQGLRREVLHILSILLILSKPCLPHP